MVYQHHSGNARLREFSSSLSKELAHCGPNSRRSFRRAGTLSGSFTRAVPRWCLLGVCSIMKSSRYSPWSVAPTLGRNDTDRDWLSKRRGVWMGGSQGRVREAHLAGPSASDLGPFPAFSFRTQTYCPPFISQSGKTEQLLPKTTKLKGIITTTKEINKDNVGRKV